MKTSLAVILVTGLVLGGCRLTFWAGEHELEIPPRAQPTPTPSLEKT